MKKPDFIETLLLYLQKCSMCFSAQLLLLDMIFLTLSRKPGKNLFTAFCPVFKHYFLWFVIVNQAYHAFQVGDFYQPTRKPWLNQDCHVSEVGDNYPGLPGKPGNTGLTWLNQAYQAFQLKILHQIY